MLCMCEGFVEIFGVVLLVCVVVEVFCVRLCFVFKFDKDSMVLCDGGVDLEMGIVGSVIGLELCV